jgi:hypothetical protein
MTMKKYAIFHRRFLFLGMCSGRMYNDSLVTMRKFSLAFGLMAETDEPFKNI